MSDGLDRVRALLAMGRHHDAAGLARTVLEGRADDVEATCLLAQALLEVDPAESAAVAERAIALDPDNEWPHRIRAFALIDAKKEKAALASARQCVRLAPEAAESHLVLANAAIANGRINEAWAAAERTVSLSPNQAQGHVTKSLILLHTRKWKDAEAEARLALRLDPENAAALNNLGVALQQQGRHHEAIPHFGSSSRLDPADSISRQNAERSARGVLSGGLSLLVVWFFWRVALVTSRNGEPAAGIAVACLGFSAYSLYRYIRGRSRRAQLDPMVSRLVEDQRRWLLLRIGLPTAVGVVLLIVGAAT